MVDAIGAKTNDLEWVQVHLTGFVQPDVPDAKFKLFAAEEFAELVVSSVTHKETVLSMCREGETT